MLMLRSRGSGEIYLLLLSSLLVVEVDAGWYIGVIIVHGRLTKSVSTVTTKGHWKCYALKSRNGQSGAQVSNGARRKGAGLSAPVVKQVGFQTTDCGLSKTP